MNVERQTEFEIYCGDCVDGMRKHVPDRSIDICVTSPPYNLGIPYRSYSDDQAWTNYISWTHEWTELLSKKLKEDGSFFLNIGGSPRAPLLPHILVEELVNKQKRFKLQNTIHWIKSIAIPVDAGERQIGHYKPVNSERFINDCPTNTCSI